MSALLELQRAVHAATLTGDAGRAMGAILADGIAAEARLRIHRHHFFTTLTEALAANFPVVCRLVDRRFFDYLAHGFIERHPPRDPCLFEYGGAFPDYIASFPACRDLPYLPDVARLEWAINAAQHAPDLPNLEPDMLRLVAPDQVGGLRFVLHPATRLVSSRFPVDRIWRANQSDAPTDTVDMSAGAVRLLVQRRDNEVAWRHLSKSEHLFLRALAAGQSLDDAVALAGAFDFIALFAEFLAGGAFAGFIQPKRMP